MIAWHRLALVAALAALVAVGLPAPGQLCALGLGMFAVGSGWLVYRRRGAPGGIRIAGAAAVTLGFVGVLLASIRVAITLAAIGHLERMVS